MLARASLALVSVAALAVAGAAVGGRTTATTVKLTTATVNAHWSQGYLRPSANITFEGTVSDPSDLTAALRPDDRAGVTAAIQFTVAAAGPFTAKLKLPPRP